MFPQYNGISAAADARGARKKSNGPTKSLSAASNELDARLLISMRLKGMEKGFNDQAESRAIVMHGAPYVSEEMAKKTGRIGRSWGCPAVPRAEAKPIIDKIKRGSMLFIYTPQEDYVSRSSFI